MIFDERAKALIYQWFCEALEKIMKNIAIYKISFLFCFAFLRVFYKNYFNFCKYAKHVSKTNIHLKNCNLFRIETSTALTDFKAVRSATIRSNAIKQKSIFFDWQVVVFFQLLKKYDDADREKN